MTIPRKALASGSRRLGLAHGSMPATVLEAKENGMSEKELELLSRIEELERHTWRNSAILRAVAMVAFTAMIGIVIASGVVGGGRGSHWSGPAWNTMWLYGLFAANAVSMFWTTHKE
jgi:hypothetical protein